MDEIENHYILEINLDKNDINNLITKYNIFGLDPNLKNIVENNIVKNDILRLDSDLNNIDKSIEKYGRIYTSFHIKNTNSERNKEMTNNINRDLQPYHGIDSSVINILLRYLYTLKTDINKYKFLINKDDTSYSNYYNALNDEIDYNGYTHEDVDRQIKLFIDLSFLICNQNENTHTKYRCLGVKKNLIKCNRNCKISKTIKKGINNKRRTLLTRREFIVEKGRNFFRKIRNHTKKTPAINK